MRTNPKLITLLVTGVAAPVFASEITIETVTGDITTDTVWDSDTNNDGVVDKVYFLDSSVSVKDAAYGDSWEAGDAKVTLTIEPGTVIAGTGSDAGTSGAQVGSLVITRSGMIHAQGTAEDPIIFTSASQAEVMFACDIDGDEFTVSEPLDPVVDGGEWGGVIVLGNAPINFTSGSSNVGETSIEGFPAGSSADIVFGGDIADDNSGVLEYVRIEFGGFEFDENEEINGLTLGGVGSGTTVRYVEVLGNTDDGFEFFGGTVSTSHLVSAFNQDESFDFDQGHQGTHQFLFAVQSTISDNAVEADGGDGDTKTAEPLTLTKVYNATFVGGGADATPSGHIFRLKDNFGGQFHNSIFTGYKGAAFRVDDQPTANQVGVNMNFTNNIFGEIGSASTGDNSAAGDDLLAQAGNTPLGTSPQFADLVREGGEVSSIDPRPILSGPAWAGDITPGAPAPAKFKGAFGAKNWAAGWTFLDEAGYFSNTFAALAVTVEKVSGDITEDTTWDSDTNDDGVVDKIYFFDSAVAVKTADYGDGWTAGGEKVTLTIEPGTVIAGTGSDAGSSGAQVGSLLVTRSGMIDARGEENCPIIFTSASEAEYRYGVDVDGDDFVVDVPNDPVFDGGEWGGVILLGNAPINFTSGSTNVGETSIEGFPAGSSADIVFGGEIADDSSGIMEYVRIEFGGFEFDSNEEINGLTMGGVGSGTTLRYIEVVGNTDDGFEYFGGTVNTSHLVSFFNQDESFDLDQGHQGTHQFLFAVQSTLSDNGTEADGGDGDEKGLEPFTLAKFYNVTYIGGGEESSAGNAFRLKENFAGQFHNSIFTDYKGAVIRMDDQLTEDQVGVNLNFTNNLFGSFGATATGDNASGGDALLAQSGNTAINTDPELLGLVRGSEGDVVSVDPRPALTSPAYGSALTQGGLWAANYRGAFGDENWARTWTYMSENGYLAESFIPNQFNRQVTVEHVAGDITADTTWDSDTNGDGLVDKIYFLDSAVAVKDASYGDGGSWSEGGNKVTLTIKPGTVIAGTGSDAGSSGAQVGAVVVTRAGRIQAQGTANNPIIFTSASEAEYRYGVDVDGDDFVVDTAGDPAVDGGEWGGVILLGSAPINFTSGSANVGETSIEGFPAGSSADIVYGGSSPTDDSGILEYVRIEFGGFEFDVNEEINGLTMGGVGSGTTVRFVEVVGNTDDGFEYFGGTVDTSHLVSFFNQDESFDLDQGHQGRHQFLFAVQSTLSDNGTEADGGDGDDKTLTPLTSAQFYNVTYVGGGEEGPSGNNGFRLKDNFAGQFHNSIFTDFGGAAVRMDDQTTANQVGVNLCFQHNVFGAFVGGATTGDNAADAATLLAQAGNSAVGTDPQLSLLVRTDGEVSAIDPRPALAGPAWGTTLLDGAPTEVDYRGAFGTSNWAHTWTYMSNHGYFNPSFEELSTPEATVVVKGDEAAGIEIVSCGMGEVAGTFDITFTTSADATYKVTGSLDLNGFPTEIETGIAGTGSEVTVTVDIPGGADTPRYFFQVSAE
ncbi:hypothetical protein [Roseibacillus ishigakijimensis]|uniref:Uncharacterized protein n=1 Tax=Roseibacillus ishigakijimensis TaxID=454146 RepID=A0A934RNS7_9BACT|nr:hypothetical protein [Roseibacillus ishigakijimensis]MBK1834205.1 hypothetical protein [Roseibacillus ishigakijimensis]